MAGRGINVCSKVAGPFFVYTYIYEFEFEYEYEYEFEYEYEYEFDINIIDRNSGCLYGFWSEKICFFVQLLCNMYNLSNFLL